MMADDDGNVSIEIPSEVIENPTPPNAVTNASGKPPLPLKRKLRPSNVVKNRRKVSDVWVHFKKIPEMEEDEEYAACNYCDKVYACHSKRNGTSALRNHLEKLCTKFPREDLKQKVLSFDKGEVGYGTSKLKAVAFTPEEARLHLAKMIVIDELPFRLVEGEGFGAYSQYLQPRFRLPCRTTLAKDCMNLYDVEKTKLKRLIKNQRLCFTTDTWTSVQNLNYMCLTGHWIDKDWVYQKRVLNFCPIPDHKGETIGDAIESCLIEWGVDKILTITVDNASSNDAAMRALKSSTGYKLKNIVANHKFLHIRCCAHIVNLVVQSGLKELNESVVKIRRAVKYVKSSPAREKFFNECVKAVAIESKRRLSLDVETRWNSTYLMLEAAEKFERAFSRLERDDGKFVAYFYCGDDDEDEGDGDNTTSRRQISLGRPPKSTDWDNARSFIKFLKMFYNVTLKFSASTNVTANEFFHEVVHIHKVLKVCASKNSLFGSMASKMMVKFNKYWGEFNSINGLLYIAIILDPRYKSEYVRYSFAQIYHQDKAKAWSDSVDAMFAQLYEHYHSRKTSIVGSTSSNQADIHIENVEIDDDDDDFVMASTSRDEWDKQIKEDKSIDTNTDLTKYLQDPVEENRDFNILAWWNVNSAKYPVIAEIARDVLAIPISTVASESAFSTGGRVLDPYRSSLKPSTVQALLCCQNWLKGKVPASVDESEDPLEDMNIGEPVGDHLNIV